MITSFIRQTALTWSLVRMLYTYEIKLQSMSTKISPLALYLLLFVTGIFGLNQELKAQVVAPDLLCVSNDTLVWTPAANPCGSFNAYLVFGSTQLNGPYNLLATITNPTINSYFNTSASGQTWYYYLQSDHNCPGQARLSSDTLDNRIPLAGPMQSVSVEGGGVVVRWEASPSPETFAYIINRVAPAGTQAIDTVYGANTLIFTDFSANAGQASETYYVLALDRCGNKSLVGDPHTTMLLASSTPNACESSVRLSWNPYNNMPQGIAYYEIFTVDNNGQASPVGRSSSTSFSYDQINDGQTICFYVEAVSNGNVRARSSQQCLTVAITQPLRVIYGLGADVEPTGSVRAEWLWDPTATITTARIDRQLPASNTVNLALPSPLVAQNFFSDPAPNTGTTLVYTVTAQDRCNNTITSNRINSLLLTGAALDDQATNRFQWPTYTHDLLASISYELVRIEPNGNELIIFTGDSLSLTFDDEVNDTDTESRCYFLRANIIFRTPDGKTYPRVLRSNRICLSQPVRLYVPNVFAPEGINRIFKPQTPSEQITEYSMEILDRWGGVLFQSSNIDTGWNGESRGEPLPQGVYLYRISLTQGNGRQFEKIGTITLIR
jgi:gliding motility-associated-like protein